MAAKKCKMSSKKKVSDQTTSPQAGQTTAAELSCGRLATLDSLQAMPLLQQGSDAACEHFVRFAEKLFEKTERAENTSERSQICFVAPVLPHTSVLDVWNQTTTALSMAGTVITSESEASLFEQYVNYSNAQGFGVILELKTLETMEENRTFLAGLENELKQAQIVVSLGETSLASYQAMKHCRNQLKRFVVWQNAPRPSQSLPTARLVTGLPQPHLAREKSVRKEILRTCDLLICFDKESATLAYLEGVSAQRIRRISRGVSLDRYCNDFRMIHRKEIRKALGLQDDEFVFLQAGPLEVETGAFDTIFAFKNLLQSSASLAEKAKLVCCGHGSAAADVRQMVVDLGLDDKVCFLSQTDRNQPAIRGDNLSHLIAVADVVIHNPVCPIGGEPYRFLDSTYDLLAAVSFNIRVISNGSGWVGEWLSRFGRTFSPGNIHSQAKMMRDAAEKSEKYHSQGRSALKALENDLPIQSTVADCVGLVKSLCEQGSKSEVSQIQVAFDQIEKAVQSQMYVDAIGAIEAAFQDPSLNASQKAWLFRTIGDCFTRLGDLENGQENYLRAAELDPYCHRTFVGLGTVALQSKQYNIAVPQFHKAIALAPNDDMANLGLGLAFEGLGETRESSNWTLRACELNVENRPALYHLVKLAHELEDYEGACAVITKYVSHHPYDVHMIYTLGGLKYKMGQRDEAQSLMEEILRIDPMNNLAHSLLGQMEREAKNRDMGKRAVS